MRTSIFSSTLCGGETVIGHFRTLVEKSRTDAVTVQILFCSKSGKNSFLCSTTIPMWCSTCCVHQVMRQKLLKIRARKAEWSYPQTDDINCQLSTADITSNHESNDSLDKCMEHSQIGSLSCIWRNQGNISTLQTENPTVEKPWHFLLHAHLFKESKKSSFSSRGFPVPFQFLSQST